MARLDNPRTDTPRLAKDTRLLEQIEAAIQQIPTEHRVLQADSRNLSLLQDRSIHLVLTSPPYWTLKKYNDHPQQLGNVDDYDQFLDQLDQAWKHCFQALVPGASTRNHPAPYSEELAMRLIRMFSFVGDTVLDPFLGTGTTAIAAARWGRNSIGIELDADYFAHAKTRITQATVSLFSKAKVTFHPAKNSYELL